MAGLMVYIGIDPGVSGGLAMLDADTGEVIRAVKMPTTERDLWDALEIPIASGICHTAYLERVSAWPGMGVVSAFTFGRGFGSLLMALTARRYPFELVLPRRWQAVMSCLSGGDKNVTKRRAQQLFPQLSVTHATADALLLAEYGRRVNRLASARSFPSARSSRHGKKEARKEGVQASARAPGA